MRGRIGGLSIVLGAVLLGGAVIHARAASGARAAASARTTSTHAASEDGQALYQLWCAGCHAAHGTPGRPMPAGTAILQARYQGRLPAVLTERTDLTVPYIEQMVRHGRNVMPYFRKTEISDQQLAVLADWLTRPKK